MDSRIIFVCPVVLPQEDSKSPLLMVADIDGQITMKVRGIAPEGGISTATIIVTNEVMRLMTIALNNEMRKRTPMSPYPIPKKEG